VHLVTGVATERRTQGGELAADSRFVLVSDDDRRDDKVPGRRRVVPAITSLIDVDPEHLAPTSFLRKRRDEPKSPDAA